jgi:hypothetical protein
MEGGSLFLFFGLACATDEEVLFQVSYYCIMAFLTSYNCYSQGPVLAVCG